MQGRLSLEVNVGRKIARNLVFGNGIYNRGGENRMKLVMTALPRQYEGNK